MPTGVWTLAAGCGSPAALSSSSSSTVTALWVSDDAQTQMEITYGMLTSPPNPSFGPEFMWEHFNCLVSFEMKVHWCVFLPYHLSTQALLAHSKGVPGQVYLWSLECSRECAEGSQMYYWSALPQAHGAPCGGQPPQHWANETDLPTALLLQRPR